jgi:hypothetical protein
MMAAGMRASRGRVVSSMVSVLGAVQCHRRDKPSLLCLVTGALDRPERWGARRRSVRPTVQAKPDRPRPGCMLLLRGRIPANLQTASHSVIETFWENARRSVPGGSIALHLCGIGHAQMFIRYDGCRLPA